MKFINILLLGLGAFLVTIFLIYQYEIPITSATVVSVLLVVGVAIGAYLFFDKNESHYGFDDLKHATQACEEYWKYRMNDNPSEGIKYTGMQTTRVTYIHRRLNKTLDCQGHIYMKGDKMNTLVLFIYSFTDNHVRDVFDNIKNSEKANEIFDKYYPFRDGGDKRVSYGGGQQINISTEKPKPYDVEDEKDEQKQEQPV